MNKITSYIKENPSVSTNELRAIFGISRDKALALRKAEGVTMVATSEELKAEIRQYLLSNPTIAPSIVCKKFNVTAMVLKRIRKDLNQIGTTAAIRAQRNEMIANFIRSNLDMRTIDVATKFNISSDIVERIRNQYNIPHPSSTHLYHELKKEERLSNNIIRRDKQTRMTGIDTPIILNAAEKWCNITDFPNYSVSNFGRIRNNTTNVLLKMQQNERGYWIINLYNCGTRKVKRVHRLVAEAFIPNPFNKPEVNHKDGNTANPYVGNLEWSTKIENMEHASREGLLTTATITPETAKLICKALTTRKADGKSLSVVAKEFNIPLTLIQRISQRKSWVSISKNYSW